VGVAEGHGEVPVSQELAEDGKVSAAHDQAAGEGVAQIMETKVLDAREGESVALVPFEVPLRSALGVSEDGC
jgi:hypothetical protein